MKLKWVTLVLSTLALMTCLIGNVLTEPTPRRPFSLAGNETFDAQLSLENDFPPTPFRMPIFHFADNALSSQALQRAYQRNLKIQKPEILKDLVPGPYSTAPGVYSLAEVIHERVGAIPSDPQLQDILNGVFQIKLPDGHYPFRELVSADLAQTTQGWRAKGILGAVYLKSSVPKEALELKIDRIISHDDDVLSTRTLAGLEDTIQSQIKKVAPLIGLAVFAMVLVIGFYFQDVRDIIAAAIGLGLLIGALSGVRKILNLPESQLSSMLPILLLALGVDYSIHSLSRLRHAGTQSWWSTVRELAPALILTTITTGLAFGSNLVAPIEDLREWGALAAIGIVLTYMSMGLVVPAIRFYVFGAPASSENLTSPTQPLGARYPKLVFAAFVILSVGTGYYAQSLKSGFDVEDFLPSETRYVQTVKKVAEVFSASGEPGTLLIRGDFSEAKTAKTITDLAEKLCDKGLARRGEVATALKDLRAGSGSHILTRESQASAFALPIIVHQAGVWSKIESAKTGIESLASEELKGAPGIQSWTATGAPFLRYSFVNALTETIQSGIPLTLLCCFLVSCVVFRSVRLSLLVFIPVIVVCVGLQAGMVALGLRLNLVTVQVASLAIGLGGDYMLHYVQRFRELRLSQSAATVQDLVAQTHGSTGRALIGSAVSTVLGFVILAFAPMPLFATFGLIQFVMILLSLCGVLTLLPALIVLFVKAEVTPSPAPVQAQLLIAEGAVR
ncbi:MAG: MMPL family transporter [Planctomycetota bacterium]|nr:MMPL family transporter [Planctomycetota bacterium]